MYENIYEFQPDTETHILEDNLSFQYFQFIVYSSKCTWK